MKSKIAISVDEPLLALIDQKVDGQILRSRSQAIEFFLRKGLREESITTAVLLIKGEHQSQMLKPFKGKKFLEKQLDFFVSHGFVNIYIVTHHTKQTALLLDIASSYSVNVEVVEVESKGNAQALLGIKDKVKGSFVVMSGDTYNDFDIHKMIRKHLSLDKLSTMGLMTRENTKGYGIAILDGDFIIDFSEKPQQSSTNIVNAGIYIFKSEVFELFSDVQSLERDLFAKLSAMKQTVGFFTYGEYAHME